MQEYTECAPLYGARVERGAVAAAEGGAYTVRSLDRPDITAPPMKAICAGTPAAGDRVLFLLFEDGSGAIIGILPD